MPSVGALDALMREWANCWSASHGFPDYYAALEASINSYFRSGSSDPRPVNNFERVLGGMLGLSHWMTPAPWGDPLRQVACGGEPPPSLRFPNSTWSEHAPYGPTVMLSDQLQQLLVQLARHMRGLCQDLDSADEAANQYTALFDGLRREFDLGIYNLNYDTAALSAVPSAYTGFSESGSFEPVEVHSRGEWGFVYHLHGSVHHCLAGEFGNEIQWNNDLKARFFDGHQGLAGDKRSEGRSFPKTTLIAGGFKLDQLLVEPFHSLYAALARHVYDADAILIGGYGFADAHMNRALRNRLAVTASNIRPPVMVLDRADANTDPMAFREDFWAHELCASLNASGSCFFEPGYSSPPLPSDLAASGAFEVSAPHRVAIWHGGFGAATVRVDNIVPWLSGEADSVLARSP
jgi:hypothetical protein